MANARTAAIRQTTKQTGAIPGGGICELWKVFDAELVNGTATVESIVAPSQLNLGFLLVEFTIFGLWIQATSVAGTPNIKVEIQQSYDDTAGNYIEPATGSVIVSSIADQAVHLYSVSPSPMPYGRIQLTGNTGNPSDTIVTAYWWMQGAR